MPADESPQPTLLLRFDWRLIGPLILLAVSLRALAMFLYPENMQRDLDAYLGIARQVWAGIGFCTPGTAEPTAFRPPLYPLVLALTVPQFTLGRVLLHLLLGGMTVSFLWTTASQLGLSRPSRCLAAALVAVDPLLIWYTSFPMTEAVCTCLSAWMLTRLTASTPSTVRSAVMTGFVFGLCVLCRPTYWIWGALLTAWWCGEQLRNKLHAPNAERGRSGRILLATLCGVALTVSPWILRNWLVMETPIVMTTHGGYTLLLANNPNFYAEVVEKPWGTTWSGDGLANWTRDVQQQMQAANIQGEVAADRWQGATAREFIRSHPGEFTAACWHRLRMFWNVVPSGEAAAPFPNWLLWLVGGFYTLWWLAALMGLIVLVRGRMYRWWPVVLLLVSFTAVHAVYWSNMRLRAPVLPGVALLAALPMTRRSSG